MGGFFPNKGYSIFKIRLNEFKFVFGNCHFAAGWEKAEKRRQCFEDMVAGIYTCDKLNGRLNRL